MFERRRDVGHPAEDLLSVFRDHGVVAKASRDNLNVTAEDRNIYQLVEPGWLVVNRMKAWQGSVGISGLRGIVSGHYLCFFPAHAENPTYLDWLLRSSVYTEQFQLLSRGVRPGQAEIDNQQLLALPILLPPLPEQRRIADFLDDQVARIEGVISRRQAQMHLLDEVRTDAALAVLMGRSLTGPRKPTGLAWLASVPESWPMVSVHAGYEVVLGKMLDEAQMTGLNPLPYLRNTNVQWDLIDTTDLKVMDIAPQEYQRFTIRAGDLLICEGGQPGRSAVWDGSIAVIGFQKALHRARGRAGNDVRWLQLFLRVAVAFNVFGVEFGQATIGHLTGEQLRGLRLPMPPVDVQRELVEAFAARRRALSEAQIAMSHSLYRLEELKRSLITAAVTGEFDVSTASGPRLPA